MNIFHPPYPNNNHLVHLRSDLKAQDYSRQLIKLYEGLNRADMALKIFLEELNADQFHSAIVNELIHEWNIKLEKRQNLAGVFYARAIVKEFEENGKDVLDFMLATKSELLENFIHLPEDLLSVTRINICVPFNGLSGLMDRLTKDVFSDKSVMPLIERVETLLNEPTEKYMNYPTFIIYLNREALFSLADVAHLLEKLNDHFTRFPQHTLIDNTFADPWNSFTNVTQGFKLYKVYMTALNLIEKVYSKELHFAYRIPHQEKQGIIGAHPIKRLLSEIASETEVWSR